MKRDRRKGERKAIHYKNGNGKTRKCRRMYKL
jgi:hypothetical protein